jgi:hypothetical protein
MEPQSRQTTKTRMQGFRRSLQWRPARPVHSKPTTVTAGTFKQIQGTKPSRTLLPEAAQKWCYEMVEPTEHIESLAQGFRAGTAIWVTDGSYKAPYGSAAFILKPSIDSEIAIKIVNQTPGRAEHMDAYRAEVAGIYGCIEFTNEFLKTHNIMQAAATMACVKYLKDLVRLAPSMDSFLT